MTAPRALRLASAPIALVLAAGLGLTACGSGGGGEAVASGEPLTADDFVERLTEAQNDAGSMHMDLTVDASGQEVTSAADVLIDEDPSKIAMNMTMEVPQAGEMEMRLVDSVMYMNLGEMSQNKFVELSSDDAGMMNLDEMLDQVDLQTQLELFDEALQDFSAEEGAETIDGVETTKYTLTLDTETMLADQELPEDMPEGAVEDTIEYDMYVGPDDLPRRIVMDISGAGTVMDFSEWGESITVEAPGDDEIVDASELGL